MNSIYRVIRNEDGIKEILGHFNSYMQASIVLFQLNHKKKSKERYMKSHNISSKYDPGLSRRQFYIDTVCLDDNSIQSVIRKEPSVGQLKKSIYCNE